MEEMARNADGDELLFVHRGEGDLATDSGAFAFGEGDFLLLPRLTTWCLAPTSPVLLLLIEARTGAYRREPGAGAGNALGVTPPETTRCCQMARGGEWAVVVKRAGQLSTVVYPFNPLLRGDTLPHAAPPLRLTTRGDDVLPVFAGKRFRVSVCPCLRPDEAPSCGTAPLCPTEDGDEIFFCHIGQCAESPHLSAGTLALHPAGLTRSPCMTGRSQDTTDHTPPTRTLLITAEDPVEVAPVPHGVEWPDYAESWKEGG